MAFPLSAMFLKAPKSQFLKFGPCRLALPTFPEDPFTGEPKALLLRNALFVYRREAECPVRQVSVAYYLNIRSAPLNWWQKNMQVVIRSILVASTGTHAPQMQQTRAETRAMYARRESSQTLTSRLSHPNIP